MAVTKPSRILANLTCAALALPGLNQQAGAARIDEDIHTDVQYGHYAESDDRMQVEIYEASLAAPVGEKFSVNLGLIKDLVSGASPMFNIKGADGKPQQVLSGASIKEERNVVNLGMSYYLEETTLNLSGGVSRENDYISEYVQGGFSWDTNQKMTTLFSTLSLSWDEIEPTKKFFTEKKKTHQLLLGVTQILDEKSLFSSNITYSDNNGYLSDPYKYVFFGRAGLRPDKRPENRYMFSWLNRYILSFNKLNQAAWHLDYRFYNDNWGIQSHTLETTWHQPLAQGWEIIPRLRFYTQDAADFYQHYFDDYTGQPYYTSDYRMANFGAITAGINLTKAFHTKSAQSRFLFRAGFEYYDRRASYHWGNADSDAFADYNSYLFTIAVKYTF